MKLSRTLPRFRTATLAVCLAGLALYDPHSARAAEPAAPPSTSSYGSGKHYKTTIERQSAGELSAEDLHQASLLSSQMLIHLNAAARHATDGKGDNAKPEIEKAQSLAGIVRRLLPTTTVTTSVKDAEGKEVYRDVQKIQDDQIPIYSSEIAVKVIQPLVEAKKDEAAVKGVKLADMDIIHSAVLVDLGYVERRLAVAAELLTKPAEAAVQLALAQSIGIRFSAHKEHGPLVEVQLALELAERMVQEKKYDSAKANLQMAKQRLETYRGLLGTGDTKPVTELAVEIDKLSGELEKPDAEGKIRGLWDKATGWFQREPGQPGETAPAEKK